VQVPVSVQKAPVGSKTYMGGYRNKQTGFTYHHASSQTASGLDRRDGWVNPENKTHRTTQTYVTKSRSMMTARECGTQMMRKDLVVDESGDKLVVSRPYFTSVQLEELKRTKTLIIQCYWRGYIARKHTWNIRDALYKAFLAQQESVKRVHLHFVLTFDDKLTFMIFP
jgi:hypothetical protein